MFFCRWLPLLLFFCFISRAKMELTNRRLQKTAVPKVWHQYVEAFCFSLVKTVFNPDDKPCVMIFLSLAPPKSKVLLQQKKNVDCRKWLVGRTNCSSPDMIPLNNINHGEI